jgi:hypothetical protein
MSWYEGNLWESIESVFRVVTPLSTTIGIIIAIFYPRKQKRKKDKEEKIMMKESIILYLEIMRDKVNNLLDDPKNLREAIANCEISYTDSGFPINNSFENMNKQNHDTIEKLYLEADILSIEKRNKLKDFIEFYKKSPNMSDQDAFKRYYNKAIETIGFIKK